jgi:AbrB family looped-hinge helix DNA binding protein
MEDISIVKMSAKGQLVVPEDIRRDFGIRAGDRFIPVALPEGILFKKIIMPDVRAEFERVRKSIRATMKKNKVTKKTVDEAVRWARQSSY